MEWNGHSFYYIKDYIKKLTTLQTIFFLFWIPFKDRASQSLTMGKVVKL